MYSRVLYREEKKKKKKIASGGLSAFAPRPSVSSRQRSPTLRALSIRSLRRELLEFLIQC